MGMRAEVTWTGLQGAPYFTALNFIATGQTGADAVGVAVSDFLGSIDNSLSSSLSYSLSSEVTQYNDTTGEPVAVFAIDPFTGTCGDATEVLPPVDQGLARLLTGSYVGGRQIRGRIFIPGLTQASNDGGRLISTWRTAISDAIALMVDQPDASLAVWSPTHGTTTAVQAVSVWENFASLRSRRD
jgi:hypothetical protein